MRAVFTLACFAAAIATGCNNKSPSGPSTITSLAIALRDVVLTGTTATATATATLDSGQTQAVTTGFRSDTPAVATVTDGGVVTGVANGEATITVAAGGREASKRIRVAPNYAGNWQGQQLITACVATVDFIGICEFEGGIVGQRFAIGLTARHPADLTVSGEFSIETLSYPTFTTPIEADGAIRFSSATTVEDILGDVSWQIRSTQIGRATGTIRERYTAPTVLDGDVIFDSNVVDFTRAGGAAGPAAQSPRAPGRLARIRAFIRR